MSATMIRLLYCSRTMIGDRDQTQAAIHDILITSRANNSHCGITGALLFTGDCFAQVLEGKANVVESMFTHIEHDPRHHGIVSLLKSPIAERLFPDWSMAFGRTDQARQESAAAAFERAFVLATPAEGLALLELIEASLVTMQIW